MATSWRNLAHPTEADEKKVLGNADALKAFCAASRLRLSLNSGVSKGSRGFHFQA